MAINAVAPWEGALEWVGEVKSGNGQNGAWKSVDFALKYTDHQMNEKVIVFSAFGAERVDKLLNLAHGTMLRVVWWPEANQSKTSGQYYGKNSVISISLAKPEVKSADTKITAPNFPDYPQRQDQPRYQPNPGYAAIPQPQPTDEVNNDDLPF